MRVLSGDGSGADRRLVRELSALGIDASLAGEADGDPEAGDAVVTMLRSVPPSLGPDLRVAAVMRRVDRSFSSYPLPLDSLREGSGIAVTGSMAAETIRIAMPRMEVEECHLARDCLSGLEEGRWVSAVAPTAELRELLPGDRIHPVDGDIAPPAPSQGIAAVICRADDRETSSIASAANHNPTRIEAGAERGIVRMMGAGPFSPVSVSASLEDIFVHVVASSMRGGTVRRVDEYLMPDYVMDDLLGIAEYLNGVRDTVLRYRHGHKR